MSPAALETLGSSGTFAALATSDRIGASQPFVVLHLNSQTTGLSELSLRLRQWELSLF